MQLGIILKFWNLGMWVSRPCPLRGPSTTVVNTAEICMCSGIMCRTGANPHANLILEGKGPNKKLFQEEGASPNYQFAFRKFLDRKFQPKQTDVHRRPPHLATSLPWPYANWFYVLKVHKRRSFMYRHCSLLGQKLLENKTNCGHIYTFRYDKRRPTRVPHIECP